MGGFALVDICGNLWNCYNTFRYTSAHIYKILNLELPSFSSFEIDHTEKDIFLSDYKILKRTYISYLKRNIDYIIQLANKEQGIMIKKIYLLKENSGCKIITTDDVYDQIISIKNIILKEFKCKNEIFIGKKQKEFYTELNNRISKDIFSNKITIENSYPMYQVRTDVKFDRNKYMLDEERIKEYTSNLKENIFNSIKEKIKKDHFEKKYFSYTDNYFLENMSIIIDSINKTNFTTTEKIKIELYQKKSEELLKQKYNSELHIIYQDKNS